ncbi:CDP-glycerol glycerophosphotransferase family protein, partial [Oceanobacillus massiliensis]|uniref:CDP-glycerol glycerophosphotransferase family protein n=1 Tax=Oceanobacillus massiliensis TaxID=1465765 RepID=UPI00301A41B8
NKMNFKLLKEIMNLSNASYLVLDDYYLPVYLFKPNSTLKVIQLWHAAGAFKKFGYSTLGKKFGPDEYYLRLIPIHSNYTHVYVSSKKVVNYYAEAFNMNVNNIFPVGIPRTDLFYQEDKCDLIKASIYRRFNHIAKLDESINILVAPTYRADGLQKESTFDLLKSLMKLSDQMDSKIRILFKPHPYMDKGNLKTILEYVNITVAERFSINEWMLVSDAFITDYSSSIFEFALLKRPMAHVIPDMKEYEDNRGFYQEVSTASDGVILENNDALLKWINERKKHEYYDTTRMVKHNFDNLENVSGKIVRHFVQ